MGIEDTNALTIPWNGQLDIFYFFDLFIIAVFAKDLIGNDRWETDMRDIFGRGLKFILDGPVSHLFGLDEIR